MLRGIIDVKTNRPIKDVCFLEWDDEKPNKPAIVRLSIAGLYTLYPQDKRMTRLLDVCKRFKKVGCKPKLYTGRFGLELELHWLIKHDREGDYNYDKMLDLTKLMRKLYSHQTQEELDHE